MARQDGVLAGRLCAVEAFAAVDPAVVVDWQLADGARPATPGQVIAVIDGPLASVLTAERTALNLLGHLSGDRHPHPPLRRTPPRAGPAIRDTRKTTPGLRALEKAAVRAGGGANHRGSLSEGLLVKDNHLAGLVIAEAVGRARHRWPGHPVEVECDTLEQVAEAVDGRRRRGPARQHGAPPRWPPASPWSAGRCAVEVSGGVTLDTVAAYAAAGADFISVGALTHSAAGRSTSASTCREGRAGCCSPSTSATPRP